MLSNDDLAAAVVAYKEHGSQRSAAAALGIAQSSFNLRIRRAAETGLLGTKPVLPGFRISQTTIIRDESGHTRAEFIQQKPERGEQFEIPAGQRIKGISALLDHDGREIIKWVKTDEDRQAQIAIMQSVVDALKENIPRATPVAAPIRTNTDLVNQFTVTDLHFGMLAWKEETGADYDLKIAERTLLDWFSAAIAMAPNAETAILAQLGDLLHHDAHESVTPAHKHVLDADSRLQKIIRVVIRTLRRIIFMLLEKHQYVHIIMADANHDPASEAWLREMFAAFYDDEPRVTVDSSASTYYAYEHGLTSLFYHHGHKRKASNIDSVFAGKFRDIYGRTKFSYVHTGHLHSDGLISTNLMKVERHETLAAPDAFNANGGYLSKRSAKVITYHKLYGEVSRLILSPEMVAAPIAANDNMRQSQAA